jgi:hypothetical protein
MSSFSLATDTLSQWLKQLRGALPARRSLSFTSSRTHPRKKPTAALPAPLATGAAATPKAAALNEGDNDGFFGDIFERYSGEVCLRLNGTDLLRV